jgi:Transposase DDE domain
MSAPKVPRKIFDTYLKSLQLDEESLDALAVETGWSQRASRSITPANLLFSLCILSIRGEASFNDIASTIHRQLEGKSASKQAVAKRLNPSFIRIVESLLADLIKLKTSYDDCQHELSPLLAPYQRVLVQDSTVIKLPGWLFEKYSGVSNGSQQVCNARIQTVYDLKSMRFLSFGITPYSKTDILAAGGLEFGRGDLVIRDRGYLSFSEIRRHLRQGADFIYRHKAKSTYRDPETLEPVDFVKKLQKEGSLDCTLLLNDKEATPVRVIARKANGKIAEERRRKARKESHSKNPSQELLALCDWTVFITNIPREDASFENIFHTYGLRWRIEIIFKTWKSHLNFSSIHRVSETELKVLLTVRLLLITEGTNRLYALCYKRIKDCHGKDLSLQKFLKRLGQDPGLMGDIHEALESGQNEGRTWEHLRKYCCYEKRKRPNYFEQCRSDGLS